MTRDVQMTSDRTISDLVHEEISLPEDYKTREIEDYKSEKTIER